MREQQAPTSVQTTTSACPHPEAVGERWGDPISEERQEILLRIRRRFFEERQIEEVQRVQLQTRSHLFTRQTKRQELVRLFDGIGPFDGLKLTGADVYFLYLLSSDMTVRALKAAELPDLRENMDAESDAVAWMHEAEEVARAVRKASVAWMTEREDSVGHIGGSVLQLQGADLSGSHLERALLNGAELQGADLRNAHLEGAGLISASLQDADLRGAHLEGVFFNQANLQDADIRGVSFDKTSHLNDAALSGASLDQVTFDNTNLTVVDWSLVDILGDERTAHKRTSDDGGHKTRSRRLIGYKAAVRANRVLAVTLQAQGLTEDANRFAYRAQVLQRQLLRRQRRVGAYFFSVLLAVLAGYGFRLGRILIAYVVALVLFAAAYFTAGVWLGATHLEWYEALLVSLTAIHGRVFITTFGLDSIQAWIAAVESVVGIVIEGVFVAMLIQRFFGR